MAQDLSASARRVQAALHAAGADFQVVELPASTRTARQAADAIGCQVGQIAKSLLFKGRSSGKPLMVIASGSNRVDPSKVAAMAGEPVELADPGFVREVTGFAIGGVPPLGHTTPVLTYLDEALRSHETIWAAAGTPHAVFALKADDLPRLTGGSFVTVAED